MSHDTLLHCASRPIVSVLAHLRVSPDLVTALRLATGLAAAGCFAAGPGFGGPGGALFLVSMLLDRADGALARRSRRFSRFGARFDVTSDCVSTMAAFVGLGIGAAARLPWRSAADAGLALGVVAALSAAALFAQLELGGDRDRPHSRRFDPDDAMLVVPLAIWCGGAGWILLLAGLLTPMAALLIAVLKLQARRSRPRSPVVRVPRAYAPEGPRPR